MSRFALFLSYAFSFLLLNSCSSKDKDITPADFLRVKDNNVLWTATTITVPTDSDNEPLLIQGTNGNQQLILRLSSTEPGNYQVRPAAQRDILPAILTNFDVEYQDSYHRVFWSTADEINTSFFDVETSGNGTDWTKVGTVPALGGSVPNYQLIVKTIAIGSPAFYRLRMEDSNGQFAYSAVRAISTEYKAAFQPAGDQLRRGHHGSFSISSIDRSKRVIAGSFHFSVTSSMEEQHTLTEGEFSVHY